MAAVKNDDMQMELERLTRELDRRPSIGLYMARGKLYTNGGVFDKALNDFLKVVEIDPDNKEAGGYVAFLKDIFEYRYMDYYNP